MKNTVMGKRLSIIIISAVFAVIMSLNAYAYDTEEHGNDDDVVLQGTESSETPALSDAQIWDIVTFGSYEQDNDASDGKEEIEWYVLAEENGRALLLSRYALDCQPYNTEQADVTWENCSLRSWLNDTFLNAAFSDEEQNLIAVTDVTADKNPKFDTDPGKNKQDKIFLLSIHEVEKYFGTEIDRQCKPTAYAKAQGAYADSGDNICCWWLRTPGISQDYAADVYSSATVNCKGTNVDYESICIRPAVWICLDS